MNDDELSLFRNTEMGFVFQFHHLVTEFNTLENVMLPLLIANVPESEAKIKATAKLDQMGLSHRLGHYPNQLSGGELQRVAIARALVRSPKILFADEPTGNLDSVNGRAIQDIFFKLHREERMALVVVTHDLNFASRFGRVLRVQDGVMT
jgi:lipoprotein-releasing system ATP-binding protein